jgi:hypothetical protein
VLTEFSRIPQWGINSHKRSSLETDMTDIIGAFRISSNSPENSLFLVWSVI